MDTTSKADPIQVAIARDGGLCVICGRPCASGEARRRIVADLAPDSPMNWVAMCHPCQEALAGRLPPPARYVYHMHNITKIRRQLYELTRWSLVTITAATWLGFAVLLGSLMWAGAEGAAWHLFMMLSAFLLLGMVWKAFQGWQQAPVQRVHHSHDPQTVVVRENR